jgi:hypothetical protein
MILTNAVIRVIIVIYPPYPFGDRARGRSRLPGAASAFYARDENNCLRRWFQPLLWRSEGHTLQLESILIPTPGFDLNIITVVIVVTFGASL